MGLGLAPNEAGDLRHTTDHFIDSQVFDHRRPQQALLFGAVRLGDRPGLRTSLWTLSEATGEPQRVEIFTTLLEDGTLFYVLAVSPRARALDYSGTFTRVVESIVILDGARDGR